MNSNETVSTMTPEMIYDRSILLMSRADKHLKDAYSCLAKMPITLDCLELMNAYSQLLLIEIYRKKVKICEIADYLHFKIKKLAKLKNETSKGKDHK